MRLDEPKPEAIPVLTNPKIMNRKAMGLKPNVTGIYIANGVVFPDLESVYRYCRESNLRVTDTQTAFHRRKMIHIISTTRLTDEA